MKPNLSQGKSIDTENCPYFSAVLLEAQRFYPAGETIMHRTSEDIQFRGNFLSKWAKSEIVISGYFIPKGTFVKGFLAAILKDPETFPDPNEFKPERFLHDGKFRFDPRVCNFSGKFYNINIG